MTSSIEHLSSPRWSAAGHDGAGHRAHDGAGHRAHDGADHRARQRTARTAVLAVASVAAAAVGAAGCSSACGGKKGPPPDLEVTSFAPAEGTAEPLPVIKVQFNHPVVNDSAVGAPVTIELIRLTPRTALTAHWVDRQTLVATPGEALKPSTRYKVELRGDLAARTGGFSFSFVDRPLDVEAVRGGDLRNLPVAPELSIQFNQDVAPAAVAKRCALRPAAGGKPIALAVTGTEPAATPATTIVFKPEAQLSQGTDYELVCEGLAGAGGDVPMAEPYTLELRTYPVFSIVSIEPDGNAIPADDVELKIRFATPVDLDAVREHIAVSPDVAGFKRGWLDATGTLYRAVASLETETDYAVTVDDALVDVYGQKLPQAARHSFTTSDAEPRVYMETGIYAVEAQSPGYGVWSRNVPSFRVECAPVAKGAVAKVLTAGISFSTYEYYGEDDNAMVDWKALGLTARDAYVDVPAAKNKWHQSVLAPGEVCKARDAHGVFLMQVSADNRPDAEPLDVKDRRVLVNVTELGVVIKAGASSGVLWVTSIASGKPVSGARVTILGTDGKTAHTGTTNADGLLRIPGTAALFPPAKRSGDEREEHYGYGSRRFIAVVEKGADMAVVDTNWDDGIETWNFGVSRDWRGGARRIRGFIQSDRGIYRPGETAHFKGLAREVANGAPPRVPRKGPVQVTVTSSRGSTVLEQNVALTRFGGFSFDVALDAEAALGDYRVTAKLGDQTFYESFSVEEFRKVSFELALDSPGKDKPGTVGEPLDFLLHADYLFGAPVTGGDVKWSVERRDHSLSFPAFGRFSFRDWAAQGRYDWWSDSGDGSSFVASGDGTTDAKGQLAFGFRDVGTSVDGPQDYHVEVTVTDPTNQSVSTRASVTAHQTDRYVGVRSTSWVQSVDNPLVVETVAVTPTGAQVATKAELTLIRSYYKCDYADGARSYPTCKTRQDIVTKRTIDLPPSGAGPGTEQLKVDRPGEYVVRLEGADTRGKPIAASTYVWVVGPGESWWSRDESSRFNLIASKTSYEPGDTAVLVPRVSMDNAHALVTLERDGVLDAYVRPMASASEGIEIELTQAHAPNVFASVTLVTGRTGPEDHARPQLKMGIIDLPVSAKARELSVAVATDKASYEPGEKVTGTVTVTAAGAPVVAEVSVSAADEGVLQVIGFKTPNPMKAFYTPWSLGVNGSTNWGKIARPTEPSTFEYEYGADYGGGGDGGTSSRVRTRFVSSAFWAPALVTDASGVARFEFTAPDNLTAFRIMGVAADTGDRFGSSEHRITIKKPLLVKPILPRFLTAGDHAQVGVVIHNYTGNSGEAKVTGKATGARLGNPTQTAVVAADGSARVLFGATAGFDASAEFQFEVALGGHTDAFALPVPINRPYVITKKTLAQGSLTADAAAPAEFEQSLAVDKAVVARDSVVTVSVDRTGMSELEPSLRYLIEYPYGCLEQTLSRFIPLTKVKDLARSLGMKSLEGDELASFIRAGAAKVVRHQKYDGNFSLWPDSKAEPHLTVYAVYGLVEARRARVRIDDGALAKGVAAIQRWVSDGDRALGPDGETATVAMAAYLLAEVGEPDAGLNGRLYAVRAGLPRYGQAFLAQALHAADANANRDQIAALVAALTDNARVEGDRAVIPETEVSPEYWSTDTRTTAIALSALLRVAPDHALIDGLAQGLIASQRPSGAWYNTQENLYALVALADYARRQTAGKATVEVYVDGKKEVRRVMTGADALVMRRSLYNAENSVKVVSVSGQVRYSVRLTEARKDAAAEAVANGFEVERDYLDPKTEQPLQAFGVNQLIKVKVTVRAAEGQHYVAVVDPLPAGFEIVNTRLVTSQRDAGGDDDDDDYEDWDWEPPTWTHVDMRDDAAMAFADRMSDGEHELEYLVRATTAGTFTALPTRVEAMYDPDVFGRTASAKITIAP